MITKLRSVSNSFIMRVFLAVVLLAVALSVGITNFFIIDPAKRPVAHVGDVTIPADQFYMELNKKKEILKEHYGRLITDQEALGLGFAHRTVAELITRELFRQEAHRLGILASDEMVSKYIHSSPLFLDYQGKFDTHKFREYLSMNRLTERKFLEEVRDQLSRGLLVEAVSDSLSSIPRSYLDPLLVHAYTPRDLEIVSISIPSMQKPANASEDELKAFYDKHLDFFKVPETKSFQALVFDSLEVSQTINLSEDDLKSAYNQQDNKQLETRFVRFIAAPTRDVAMKAKAEFDSGARYEDVFTRYMHQPAEQAPPANGFTLKTLVPEISSEVFALPRAKMASEPVQFRGMFIVAYVTEIQKEKTLSFEEQRFGIQKRLVTDLTREKMYDFTQKAEKMLASGTKLAEVADILKKEGVPGVALKFVGPVTQDGKNIDGQLSPEADELDPAVLSIAFDTPLYNYSDPKALPTNDYVIVEVTEQKAPYQRAFEEAKVLVEKFWVFEKQREKAAEKIKLLQDASTSKKSLLEVAKANDLEATVLNKITRAEDHAQSEFSGVIRQLNVLGLHTLGMDLKGETVHIGMAVKEYSPENLDDKAHAFSKGTILPMLKQDIISSIIAGTEAFFPVRNNEDFFKTIFGKEEVNAGQQLQAPDF